MALQELFATILNVSPESIGDDTSPKTQPSWDSLRHIEVVMALESSYRVRFSTAEVLAINSVANARDMLQQKGIAAV